MSDFLSWKTEDQLKAIALLGAAIAFAVGVWQYRKAQKWKRAEWVAQEIKSLIGDPMVRAALFMIDWGSRRVELYPWREKEVRRFVHLTDDIVAQALKWHKERPEGFSDQEATIRNAFDAFLDGLERLSSYERSGLVTISDLEPYLQYWARKICKTVATDGSEGRLASLQIYMKKYEFDGARRLLTEISSRKGAT